MEPREEAPTVKEPVARLPVKKYDPNDSDEDLAGWNN
jgi:hypothetical protein